MREDCGVTLYKGSKDLTPYQLPASGASGSWTTGPTVKLLFLSRASITQPTPQPFLRQSRHTPWCAVGADSWTVAPPGRWFQPPARSLPSEAALLSCLGSWPSEPMSMTKWQLFSVSGVGESCFLGVRSWIGLILTSVPQGRREMC